jgi:hypothetical protein
MITRTTEKKIAVIMDEYRALRDEVIQTKASRNAILSLGFATLGVFVLATAQLLIGSGALLQLTAGQRPLSSASSLPFCMLTFVIPGWCLLLLVLSLAEEERMKRVGRYLKQLEADLNRMAGAVLLNWEHWLVQRRRHLGYSSLAVMAALAAMAAGSLWLAAHLIWNALSTVWFCIMVAVVSCVVLWVFRHYAMMIRGRRVVLFAGASGWWRARRASRRLAEGQETSDGVLQAPPGVSSTLPPGDIEKEAAVTRDQDGGTPGRAPANKARDRGGRAKNGS